MHPNKPFRMEWKKFLTAATKQQIRSLGTFYSSQKWEKVNRTCTQVGWISKDNIRNNVEYKKIIIHYLQCTCTHNVLTEEVQPILISLLCCTTYCDVHEIHTYWVNARCTCYFVYKQVLMWNRLCNQRINWEMNSHKYGTQYTCKQ